MSVELYDQDAETTNVPEVTPGRRPVDPPEVILPARPSLRGAGAGALAHLARVPRYGLRVAHWAPVGAWRILRAALRWVADVDGRVAGEAQLRRENPAELRRLDERHDAHVKHRLVLALVVLLLLAGAAAAGWTSAPWWGRTAALLALLLLLARVGRPADKPILDRVTATGTYRRLTADLVRTALLATGHGKAPGDYSFPAEIARHGAGYLATVDLPHGVTAGMVADRRDRLASALRLPIDQAWVRTGRHAGQVELYVADEPVSARRMPAWPLARTGRVDLFTPVPLGVDERGEPVAVTLAYSNLVVGAIPRMGKTVAVRLLLLAAALDPRVRILAADLKGTGDFGPLAPVCERLFVGDDDDDLDDLLSSLRELHRDLRRRTRVVRDLPRDLAPDSKVTGSLVDNPDLGLSPILLGVDECQVLFTDDRVGSEAEKIVTDLVKRGPAVGIVVVLATQRPDAKSLPTGITAAATMRLAFRVMDQVSNDAVLGTSMYRAGVRATQFPTSAKGTGWLVGAHDEPTVLRVHHVDGPAADRVVARAVRLRGGPIAHQPREVERVDLVADVAAVWPDGQDATWSADLAPRLAALRPDVYSRLDVTTLNAQLRAAGVEVKQLHRKVNGTGTTKYGVRRAAIDSRRASPPASG